jgi:excisionase family DNA binding protein
VNIWFRSSVLFPSECGNITANGNESQANPFYCGNIFFAVGFAIMSGNMNQLTTEEAAHALGITPSRVRQMIRAGQLPATRFGKAHLIYEKDLALVQERPVGRPPAQKAARKNGRK